MACYWGNEVLKSFLVAMFSIFLVLLGQWLPAEDSKDASEKGEWVSEIEPGIKRYGIVPKFSEVGSANAFDVSPDGQTIAFASGSIKLWDIDENKVRDEIKSSNGASFLEYSPDGTRLYVLSWGHEKKPLLIYNAITGEEEMGIKPVLDGPTKTSEVTTYDENEDGEQEAVIETVEQPFSIQGVTISPNDDRVALFDGYRALIYDTNSGEKVAELKSGDNYVQKYVFIDDGEKLLASNGNIYSCETGEKTGTWPKSVFNQWSQSVSVNPKNSNQIAVSEWNKGVILYDLEQEEKVKLELDTGTRHYSVTAFSGNGKLLAAGSQSYNAVGNTNTKSVIYVWNVETGKLENKFEHHSQHQAILKFSSNSEKLYSKSHNEIGVTEWDLSKKTAKSNPKGHTSPVYHLRFASDNESIFTSSYGGGAIIFDLETGEPKKRLSMNQVGHLTSSDDGRYFVSAATYQMMSIYDRESGKNKQVRVKSFRRPTLISRLSRIVTGKNDSGNGYENFGINHICVADDDEHIWLASRGQRNFRVEKFTMPLGKSEERYRFKMSKYWESPEKTDENGNVIPTHSQLQWQPRTLSVSSDGELVAILNDQKEVFVIDMANGEVVQELGEIGGDFSSRLYFVNGAEKLLVYANGELKAFDPRSGEQIGQKVKVGQQHSALQMALCRKESQMALISQNQKSELKIIDLDSMEELFSRKTDEHHNGISISDDGRKIALAKNNCQFDIWDLDVLDK